MSKSCPFRPQRYIYNGPKQFVLLLDLPKACVPKLHAASDKRTSPRISRIWHRVSQRPLPPSNLRGGVGYGEVNVGQRPLTPSNLRGGVDYGEGNGGQRPLTPSNLRGGVDYPPPITIFKFPNLYGRRGNEAPSGLDRGSQPYSNAVGIAKWLVECCRKKSMPLGMQ